MIWGMLKAHDSNKGRMTMRTAATTAAICSVLALATPAWSQQAPTFECGQFTLEVRFEAIRFFDVDPVGISIGDYRVGRNGLYDDHNTEVGHTYFSSTVIPSPIKGQVMDLLTAVHEFANGTVVSSALLTNVSSNPGFDSDQAISGGTGAFADAHGTAEASTDEAGKRSIRFDISCN